MSLQVGPILLLWTLCNRVHTKGANIQAAGPASGKVICCLAQHLVKGAQQKVHGFHCLPHLCKGSGGPVDSTVRYGESSLHPSASHSLLFYLCLAKMCWSQAQNLPSGEELSCRWLQQHSVKDQKNPLLIGIFVCSAFLCCSYYSEHFFSFFSCFWFQQFL